MAAVILCPTITVCLKANPSAGTMVINQRDYNPAIHALPSAPKPASVEEAASAEETTDAKTESEEAPEVVPTAIKRPKLQSGKK